MKFLRVYLQNDGNIKRGAVSDKSTGKLIPDKSREIWFNYQAGMIAQIDQNGLSFYSCNNIQGDPSFLIRCFKDHFEIKTFDKLVGNSKKVIDFENKNEDTHREPVKRSYKKRK